MYVFGQEYYKWFQNIASPQKSPRELLKISSPIPDLVKSEFTGMDLGTSVFEAGIVSCMVIGNNLGGILKLQRVQD